MANPIVNVINRLKTDATLVGTLGPTGYSGILQGGVWDRPLRRDPGPGQTVDAFYEAGVRGRMIRPSIVVVDRGDAPHPQEEAIYTAYRQDCYVYFYAPATTSGKNSIYAAQGRVKQLLHYWRFQTDDGPWASVDYVGRLGVYDNEEFIGSVMDYSRYQITSRFSDEV
ncbi:MAG: hypothetical protein M3P94_06925 [Chloroflexota bacterium]|nr:hypothetical protein [Chloroflexota bacterium]